ncbi:zinc ribbon domain-containing protein, partial [Paraburkholderia sp. SIMBA_050]
YAYRCEACGFAKDMPQKMSDAPLSQCPECGKDAFRKQEPRDRRGAATDARAATATATPRAARPDHAGVRAAGSPPPAGAAARPRPDAAPR